MVCQLASLRTESGTWVPPWNFVAKRVVKEEAFGIGELARATRRQLEIALAPNCERKQGHERLEQIAHLDASLATPLACLQRHVTSGW